MNEHPDPSSLTPGERTALLDDTLQAMPPTVDGGRILLGGEEASLLWDATVDSFASGVWVATLLCAQATCERALAGLVSLRELPGYADIAPTGWEDRWGMGKFLGHVREQGWIPDDLMDEVAVLCEARKPYGHFRRPFDPGTIGREVAEALLRGSDDADPDAIRARVLSRKAHHAATTTLRLYFGDYGRAPSPSHDPQAPN